MKHKILSLLVLLLTAATGAWADDYTITLPTVSNGSVAAKVNDTPVTSAAAGATVSLVATPDAGYKLKTISATTYNISETFSKGANTRTGTYFRVSGNNNLNGWRIGSGDHYTLTISSLSNQNLSQVVLTVGGPANAKQRNISHLQADHGTLSATGTTQGNTITITGINSPTVTVSAPGSNNGASMWSITQAKIDGLGNVAVTLTDTGDDNVKTFIMPSGNVTVSAEFEEPTIEVTPVAGKTNEWTFTMPAYDVELTPVYAPAAQWALVETVKQLPTAAKGVIAGTTDPIVKAGTVALMGDNETPQGVVMYAVTPATVTEAPALTAFSATLPTAKDIADEGAEVLVWYYIKGADTPQGQEATAKNTFNDSEICETPIKVTVLSNKFDIEFKAANANTIEAGKATVKVGETDATVTDGKLEKVKMDSKVTVTAKEGYKFRKVEGKKGIAKLLTIGEVTLDITDCTTWMDVIRKNFPKIESSVGYVWRGSYILKNNSGNVSTDAVVDPNATDYYWAADN